MAKRCVGCAPDPVIQIHRPPPVRRSAALGIIMFIVQRGRFLSSLCRHTAAAGGTGACRGFFSSLCRNTAAAGTGARRTSTSAVHGVAAAGFENQAETYEATRPSYPKEALEHIVELISVGSGQPQKSLYRVLDLASGTGIFTRRLLDYSQVLQVTAVEPVAAMRKVPKKKSREERSFHGTNSTSCIA